MAEGNGNVPAVQDRDPWEKQPKESFKAFSAFAVYRDLGPNRSLSKVAGIIDKALEQVKGWSAKHHWVERCEQYDLYIDRRRREESEGDLVAMRRREGAAAALLWTNVFERLRGDKEKGIPAFSASELEGVQDIVAAAKAADFLDRISKGQPTDLIKGLFGVINVTDYRRVTGDIVDLLMRFVPEERKPLAYAALEAYTQTTVE